MGVLYIQIKGATLKTKEEIKMTEYERLVRKAIETEAEEDMNALGEWFRENDSGMFWNGECYDASLPGEPTGTRSLYPVVRYDNEYDCYDTVGWSFSNQ